MTKRVVLYCRQSVEKEEGAKSLSIESQVVALRERCAKEGWEVVGVEVEPGLKGWMDDAARPALRRCIEMAEVGGYNVLLVWDLSRFARDVRLQETWIWQLSRFGVEVVSHTEPHAGDEMVRVIFGAMHQRERKIVSGHVTRAIGERTRAGRWHGPAPYGMRRGEDGKLVPDPDTAGVVADVFAHYVQGWSLLRIATWLTAAGRRAPTGGRWHVSTLRNILRCKAYVGTVVVGGTEVEGAHAPIVSAFLWVQAQERLRRSWERAPRQGSTDTFLAGLARCGCGTKLYPVRWRARGRVMLRCGSKDAKRIPCDQPQRQVELHIAEAFVRRQLAIDLASTVSWEDAYAEALVAHRAAAPDEERVRKVLDRREARATQQLDNANLAWTAGEMGREERDRVRVVALAELAAVEGERSRLPEPPDPEDYRLAAVATEGAAVVLAVAERGDVATIMRTLGCTLVLRDGGLRLVYSQAVATVLGSARRR